jgi:hypothetical protein
MKSSRKIEFPPRVLIGCDASTRQALQALQDAFAPLGSAANVQTEQPVAGFVEAVGA